MEVRPIKTEEDYRATLRDIELLMDAEPNSPEEERLEVLGTLVQAYEAKHYPILPPDPIEAIEYRMACLGMTRKDLEKSLGGRGKVSEILGRRRPMSLQMIRQTSAHLDIPADILIRPYATQKPGGNTKKARSEKAGKTVK